MLGAQIRATLVLAVGMVTVSLYLYNVGAADAGAKVVKLIEPKDALSDPEDRSELPDEDDLEKVEVKPLMSTPLPATNGTAKHPV